MGLRDATKRDLAEELERVKRHIGQAVLELTEARTRMPATPIADDDANADAGEAGSEAANLCISLELALADTIVWAQRLAEKAAEIWKTDKAGVGEAGSSTLTGVK